MKVLVVSNLNPHFTNTNVYRLNAIRKLGHEALFFSDNDFFLPGRIRDCFGFLQAWDLDRLNRKLVRTVAGIRPDICVFVGGFRTTRKALTAIKATGTRIALWTTDAPINYDNILKTASVYDHVFCAGTEAVSLLEQNGVKYAKWLPFACDPDYHRPSDTECADKADEGTDIVFVGGFTPNRWNILNRLCHDDYSVGVWGPFWHKAPVPLTGKCLVTSGYIDVAHWVKLYRRARIVLIVHYQDGFTPCHQASPKVFEALACGCFVLVDRQQDVQRLFADGEHLVVFDNIEDLKKKIRYYLKHPEERETIADRGRQETLAKHTYLHRFKTLFNIIKQAE
jgi:spore maturation protein CgeB